MPACRALLGFLLGAMLVPGIVGCTGSPGARVRAPYVDPDAGRPPSSRDRVAGRGAAPGDERGPGGFVPRRDARSFYSAGGGRLWYYLNTYYWAPVGLDPTDLWIHADVVERFADLRRWEDPRPVAPPASKRTVEYWKVGRTGRAVKLDNHKDFCLLEDDLCMGAIEVRVVLTLGRLETRRPDGTWGMPREGYVLESRDYGKERGVGAEAVQFTPLAAEPVTAWAYRVPWSSLPGRMTRSAWEELSVPTWTLLERRPPLPRVPLEPVVPGPALTPSE